MTGLIAAAAFLVVLMPLVVVHELGHYFAARIVGVRVERFCIWLGRPVWSRRSRIGATTWALAPIPLGGYVLLLDSRHGAPASLVDRAEDLAFKSPWQRIFVSAAGPLANLVLAVVLLTALFMAGCPEPAARVRAPAPGSAAERAGLHSGDVVEAVGTQPVRTWEELRRNVALALAANGEAQLLVVGTGGQGSRHVTLRGAGSSDLVVEGLQPWRARARVGSLDPQGAALRAGVQPGDIILAVDDVDTPDGPSVVARLRAAHARTVVLAVERAGRVAHLRVDVERDRTGRVRLGVQLESGADVVTVHYPPGAAFWLGCKRAVEILAAIVKAIGGLVAGTVPVSALAGPVGLAREAGRIAGLGIDELVYFAAGLSLNLGLLNLLPIGMLDGGAIVGALFEAVRGRPASAGLAGAARIAGIVVLAALFGLATMNDFSHLG